MINSKMNIKQLLVVTLMLVSSLLCAQDRLFTQYKFHRLNETDGLENTFVNDILEDTLGLIWVATEEGLYRYHGFGFQQFIKRNDGANSFHNNYVEKLYLDKSNNIWLMTEDGVAYYSYQEDAIIRYKPEDINGRMSSMVEDEMGVRYFGVVEGGIIRVANDKYDHLKLEDEGYGRDFSDASILDMLLIGNQIWATVEQVGILSYHLLTGETKFYNLAEMVGKDRINFYNLSVDHDNNIWIPSKGIVYRIKTGNKIEIDLSLSEILPKDEDYLSSYREKETLWIGSRRKGLFKVRIDPNNQYELIQQFEYMQDEQSISTGSISKILKTTNGSIWLGNHNNDINVFDPNGETVRIVTHRLVESSNSLAIEKVWGLANSKDGQLLVGLDGQGLSKLDLNTGSLQNNIYPSLGSVAVLGLYVDSKGRLWIGTYADGLFMCKDNKIVRQFTVGSEGSELTVNDIRAIHETSTGEMYFGSNQGGLYYLDEDRTEIQLITETSNLDIRAVESTDPENLWLGTYGRGLMKYDILNNKLRPTVWQSTPSHSRDVVFGIIEDEGFLYVATRQNTLVKYDYHANEISTESYFEKLSGRSVFGLEKDLNGNIWMISNNGVAFLDKATGLIKRFGNDEGFQSGHFNYGSILRTNSGYIAVGGVRGLNVFSPKELLGVEQSSKIIINQLKIFDQVVNPMNSEVFPTGKSIFLTDKVHLSYSDNIFSFQFSYPGFTSQKKDDFVYMLDGYEREWQYGAESNVATYRNVPPGNYTFRVKSNQGGIETSLVVIITPPIWKTWQAYLVYLILSMIIIWRLIQFNNSRLALRQTLEFEQELREQENVMMQEKLRFYTNFSHELKTPLTLIQGPVNDLLRSAENKRDKKYLQLIKKNTGIILKFINRMLEFRKIEINKTVLNVGLHDIKILAQEEAESFSYLAKDRGVKFGFYSESNLEAWVDLEKMQIVLNNLLSNALKFTPEGKSVHFGVFEKEGDVVIEIKDEGVGIKKTEISSIFSPFFQASNSSGTGGTGIGLALSKSFVELHLGTIDVSSKLGEGTSFIIKIPADKEHFKGLSYVRFVDGKKRDEELLSTSDHEPEEIADLQAKENEKVLLVVDDNKDILSYVESLFDEEYYVVKKENGKDAFEYAINNTPDIIISDLMMPGMDGLEFCDKIKSNISTSHVPVIMLTAKDSKEDKIKGYEVGADQYVTKPFSSDLLMARVNNLLKNRAMLELKYESSDLVDPVGQSNSKEIEFILNAESITLQMLENSDFSVPMLCKELGMSQSALYRKIKTLTGVSIQVFIRKIRIKRAAELLLTEDSTVSEIAFALEFSDLKYFRKCFKEQFGMIPSEYRAKQFNQTDDKADE